MSGYDLGVTKDSDPAHLIDEPLVFGLREEHRQIKILALIRPGKHKIAPDSPIRQDIAIANRNDGEAVIPGPRLDSTDLAPPHRRHERSQLLGERVHRTGRSE